MQTEQIAQFYFNSFLFWFYFIKDGLFWGLVLAKSITFVELHQFTVFSLKAHNIVLKRKNTIFEGLHDFARGLAVRISPGSPASTKSSGLRITTTPRI
jgi:hypothetical protein